MQFNDSNPEKSVPHSEKQQRYSKLNFLSSISLICSIVSILCSSFLFYNFLTLQRELKTTRQTLNQVVAAPNSTSTSSTNQHSTSDSSTNQKSESVDIASSSSKELANSAENQTTQSTNQTSVEVAEVKPGMYVNSGFDEKAQVELLQVNRIQNPNTGLKDLVNVRFRLRRVADEVLANDGISARKISAREPFTSEDYQPFVDSQRGADSMTENPIMLENIPKGGSVDAYVWLIIPEGVKAIDLLIPEVKDFDKVPISDSFNQGSSQATEVKPGIYIKPAFGNRAKIELLQVNRVQARSTGNKDFVNVQFQVIRVADRVFGSDEFYTGDIKFRNPETSEVGKVLQGGRRFELEEINKSKPVKTSVWLDVPVGVKAIDIVIPQTQIFENIPIKNLSNPS